jgi:hypothetical protein
MKRMTKLPQEQLNELVNIAETELRVGGNLTTATNKIENIAYNRGFKVDRKEVKGALVAKLASEVAKELNK